MEPSLKQKSAKLRRDHILGAALGVFARTGFPRATMGEVAQAAGVAEGTIYNAFANKADLLLSLLDPLAERLPGAEAAMGPPAALFRDRWATLTPEVLDLLRVILSEALIDPALREAFRARVLDAAIGPLESGMARAGVPDAAFQARAAVAGFLGLAVLKMLDDPVLAGAPDSVADRLAPMLAAAGAGA